MIYDITQELLCAEVYPGDPVPGIESILTFDKEEPDSCQLTKIFMGSHSGTHMDAPSHFIKDGRTIEQIDLKKCIGECKVVTPNGTIQENDVSQWLSDGIKRLLFRGDEIITKGAAEKMRETGLLCIGIEGLSVGSMAHPAEVHKILLQEEIVILEGLNLSDVEDGIYELIALPLKIAEIDGSPVRAILRR